MASTRKDKLHVVVFPLCTFGHIIPFFQLSKSLAAAGVSVSFVSTPRNIERLPHLPPALEPLLKLVPLPMPCTSLLPPGVEATCDVTGDDMKFHLILAFDLLQKPFRDYVASAKPDWIIADFFPPWAPLVARDLGVPLIFFSVFSSAVLLFYGPPECMAGEERRRLRSSPETLTHPPEWVPFPSSVAFRGFEAEEMHPGLYGRGGPDPGLCGSLAEVLLASRAVAVRTCPEAEGPYLDLYRNIMKDVNINVIPTGLLLPEEEHSTAPPLTGEWVSVFKWMDEQEERSVVFVGFGSECRLTKPQVHEIAGGLESSGLPFVWALRRPSWAARDEDALPPGFSRRTAGRGVVSMGWAPQMEILGHRAIGGSLFHAGWGSAIEALQFGHALVVVPLIYDQGLNARLLVEKGLAVEVERSDNGSFTARDIARSLKLAMLEEEGEDLRVKAREAAAVFGDKKRDQQRYFNAFVDYLKDGVGDSNN